MNIDPIEPNADVIDSYVKVTVKTEDGIDLNIFKTLDPDKEILKYVQEKCHYYSGIVDRRYVAIV